MLDKRTFTFAFTKGAVRVNSAAPSLNKCYPAYQIMVLQNYLQKIKYRHKDGNCSCRAHQLGCPNDTHANNKQPPKVKAQPAKVMGKQQRLDLSSEEDDSETK